jgi:hypothetical protein
MREGKAPVEPNVPKKHGPVGISSLFSPSY